ncbi:MAG: hypothetical protein IJD92_00660 [Bacilli bacterium]|nr:hypothetical protein [Bacilli bacterium]
MNELLFGNIIEKEALENILALNQIKKCDNAINNYNNEINEQKNNIINTLENEGIKEDYIGKLDKYKKILSNMTGENDRISELSIIIEENENRINEFQDKVNELESRQEELKKEIFETNDPSKVIECQNEIENNNVRINDLNEILNGLISDNTPLLIEKEYLIAKNSDFDFNIPNYNKEDISKDLDELTKEFNTVIEGLDLPIRENIEFCQKKIKNREIEIEKLTNRKNSIIEAFPNSISFDLDLAYTDIENLLEELDIKQNCTCVPDENIFDCECECACECDCEEQEEYNEVVEETTEPEIEEDIKDEISLIDDTEEVIEEKVEEDIKEENEKTVVEPEVEENIEDSKESEEIGSVSYVLSEGESLVNIAEKVYPSASNWEAIYYFNKEEIDKYLVSNGISNDFETVKELANDTSLFAGIKLEIPTDYNYKI